MMKPSGAQVWMSLRGLHAKAYGPPLVLLALIAAAYAPVWDAGFLNYDDPWLFAHNPFYAASARHTPWHVFFDFSKTTRLALGAEYLPLRDLLGWCEVRLWGLEPQRFHAVSIALYGVAVLSLRGALRVVLPNPGAAELSTLLFALHPVHVESVAWLAGQKDALALCWIGLALYCHAKQPAYARVVLPLLVLAACFSKAMSVVVLILLGAQDYVLRRRPDWVAYLVCGLFAAFSLAVHLYVGKVVGMVAAPAGGSRYTALITMGPVWLRYLHNTAFPTELSITHRVPDTLHWHGWALAGYAFVLLSFLGSVWLATRRVRLGLFVWLWFFVPLAPVSQIGAPLQNRMADRYAWLSVLAPCLVVACLLTAWRKRAQGVLTQWSVQGLMGAVVVALFVLTFQRSVLFTDGVLLFTDAAMKAPDDPKPAYHMARSLAEAGRVEEAQVAYRETLRRPVDPKARVRRSAANGLASLLARRGELLAAEQVLRDALRVFPGDPKLRENLAKVLRATGRALEAEQLQAGAAEEPEDASEPRE